MLNGGSMVWGFCVYFVYMIPLETDVLRKHRFQKWARPTVKGRLKCNEICYTDIWPEITLYEMQSDVWM